MTKHAIRNIFKFRKPGVNDRFKKFRHEHSLLFAAFVLGITTIVVLNTIILAKIFLYGAPVFSQNPGVTVYPGWTTSLQLAGNGAMQAQVRNVAMHDSDPVFHVSEAQKILAMDVTVKNTTTSRQHFIPVNNLYVRSEEGTYSALRMSVHAKNPIPAQEIDPGETVSGQITFAVPSTVATPLLYVDTGWDRTVPLVIDVLH